MSGHRDDPLFRKNDRERMAAPAKPTGPRRLQDDFPDRHLWSAEAARLWEWQYGEKLDDPFA